MEESSRTAEGAVASPRALPLGVNWDITYACPLRCGHCYSESGRRASRQLALPDMLRVADAIAEMRPVSVQISGGEPLVVKGFLDVGRRFRARSVPAALYTSGFGLTEPLAREILGVFYRVDVSIDGATAATHDAIRGRDGSFDAALDALAMFDRLHGEVRRAAQIAVNLTIVRSNFDELERLCSDIVPRFPSVRAVVLNAAVPSGLASRSYAPELLDEERLERLRDPALAARLQAVLPAGVDLCVTDNHALKMHPDDLAAGRAAEGIMHVEPDGGVRGPAIYEGIVGNLLDEAPEIVWARARERMRHPFMTEQLRGARTMQEWAAAARSIDLFFAAPADLVRLRRGSGHTEASNPHTPQGEPT